MNTAYEVAEYVHAVGKDDPTRAWILSEWDTWHRNPFYSGPPVQHPEAEDDADVMASWNAEAIRHAANEKDWEDMPW